MRFFTSIIFSFLFAANAQAALIASFNFNSNLNVTSKDASVTVAGFTPISSRMAYAPTSGVDNSGAGWFTLNSTTSFQDAASLTLSRSAGVSAETVSFQMKKGAVGGDMELRITNSRTDDVFILQANSGSFVAQNLNLKGNSSPSIAFTFAFRNVASGSGSIFIDNFRVDGIVPEPGSIAVFAGLGLAGFGVRRRIKKSA